jgi:hypothetical protein
MCANGFVPCKSFAFTSSRCGDDSTEIQSAQRATKFVKMH